MAGSCVVVGPIEVFDGTPVVDIKVSLDACRRMIGVETVVGLGVNATGCWTNETELQATATEFAINATEFEPNATEFATNATEFEADATEFARKAIVFRADATLFGKNATAFGVSAEGECRQAQSLRA